MRIVLVAGILFCSTACGKESERVQMQKDMQFLTSKNLDGRKTGTSGVKNAAIFIKNRFEDIGLKTERDLFDEWCEYYTAVKIKGENIVARLPPGRSDRKTIIIGAHYDGVRYPAANDNASGVAVLLALAERTRVKKWNHDLIFIVFGAEEQGLCGSQHFVKNNSTAAIRYMLNLDMVGQSLRDKGRPLYVLGDDENQELRRVFQGEDIIFGNIANLEYEWSSDHASFHDVGIPSVLLIGGNSQDHHSPTDTEEKTEYDYMEKVLNILFDALIKLDKEN